jgi:hypothetical protein
MIKKVVVTLTVSIGLFIGCTSDKEELLNASGNDCTGINSSFSTKVFPIIQTNCAVSGCHESGSTNGPGALTSFAQISNASTAIKAAVRSGLMPQGGSLSAGDIKIISCWVDSGAPNN